MMLKWGRKEKRGSKTKAYEGENDHKSIAKNLTYNEKYHYNNTHLQEYVNNVYNRINRIFLICIFFLKKQRSSY